MADLLKRTDVGVMTRSGEMPHAFRILYVGDYPPNESIDGVIPFTVNSMLIRYDADSGIGVALGVASARRCTRLIRSNQSTSPED